MADPSPAVLTPPPMPHISCHASLHPVYHRTTTHVYPLQTDTAQRQGGYSIRSEGLRFINSSQRVAWTPPFNQIFMDQDGSLTGQSQGTVIPYTPFNDFRDPTSGCSRAGPVYDGGIVCDSSETVWPANQLAARGVSSSRDVAVSMWLLLFGSVCFLQVRRLVVDGVNPRELDFVPMAVVSTAGVGVVTFKPREDYGWVTPVVMRRVYRLFFKAVPEFQTMRLKVGEPEYLGQGEWVQLRFNYTNLRSFYKTSIAAANGSFVVPVGA